MLMNRAEAQLFLSLMFAAFTDNELVANKAPHLLTDLPLHSLIKRNRVLVPSKSILTTT